MRRGPRIVAAALAAVAIPVSLAMAFSRPAPSASLDVRLHEDRIELSATSLRAGAVALRTSNAGRQEHELLIVETNLPADRIPLGLEGPAVRLAGRIVYGKPHSHEGSELGRHDAFEHLPPGMTRRDRLELAPGRYVLLCTLPGHYQAGQRAPLRVTAEWPARG